MILEIQKLSFLFKVCVISSFLHFGCIYGSESSSIIDDAYRLQEAKDFGGASDAWSQLLTEDPDNPEYHFRYGLVQSWLKNYDTGETHLKRAIELQPNNGDAKLALANLYIWTNRLNEAKELFTELSENGSGYEEQAKKGLEKIAAIESDEDNVEIVKEEKQYDEEAVEKAKKLEEKGCIDQAACIWRDLYLQDPTNILYANNYGKILGWQWKYCAGEAVLLEVLSAHPDNAETLYYLGNLYAAWGYYSVAYAYLARASSLDPENQDTLYSLARSMNTLLCPFTAQKILTQIVKKHPDNEDYRIALNGVRYRTRPLVREKFIYASEREFDQASQQIAAQRLTFLSTSTVGIPLNRKSTLEGDYIFGYEREKNLVSNQNNFHVKTQIYGARLEHFLSPNWKLKAVVNRKEGRNKGASLFPFQNSSKTEPLVAFEYADPRTAFALVGNIQSFIVKNFLKLDSSYVDFKRLEYNYNYNWGQGLRVCGISNSANFYNDQIGNRKYASSIWVQTAFPKYENGLYGRYQFNYSGFDQVNFFYYSYLKQWEHVLSAGYLYEICTNLFFETRYTRSWVDTRTLSDPINTFEFMDKRYMITNRVFAELRKVLSTHFDFNVAGEYYWDTQRYRAWLVKGGVLYVF